MSVLKMFCRTSSKIRCVLLSCCILMCVLLVIAQINIARSKNDVTQETALNVYDGQVFQTPPMVSMEDTHQLIYLRLPKTGSTTTRILLETIAKRTNVKYVTDVGHKLLHVLELPKCNQTLKNILKASLMVEEVTKVENNDGTDTVLYSGDINYIDFRRHMTTTPPVYISILRDPFEKLVSHFYYGQRKMEVYKEGSLMDTITYDECVERNLPQCTAPNVGGYFKLIPSYCGDHDLCRYQNIEALNMAKRNVMRDFAVVGLSEHYTETLQVFEHIFPQYFNGLSDLFTLENEGKKRNVNEDKAPPKNSTITRMKSLLSMDYEFYNFIKQRLFMQHKAILNNL